MPFRSVSAENLAEARRLYEGTRLSGEEIAARSGVSRTTVRRYADAEAWVRPSAAPERETVVSSLRQRIEREIVAAENAMSGVGDERDARIEKMSRSLASLVRTLRELGKYDEEQARRAGGGRGPALEDEAVDEPLADLDALRAGLAERLERLRRERRS